MFSKKKIGLTLSGGAARGFAHIGVLKVLQENSIPIHYVTGTSVGSIVGALICGGYGWEEILKIARDLKWSELVRPTLSGMGLVKSDRLENFINDLLGSVEFRDLEIPLRVVAVDLNKAEELIFDSGSVARAVRASSSVPGIFEPVQEKKRVLVDGGVINNLPCSLARKMGAQKVIAVDLNANPSNDQPPENLLDITYRSFAIMLNNSSMEGRSNADIVIQPELHDYNYHDLSKADDMVRKGEEAAQAQIKRLKRLR
ncbi:patatin-like phospholipase family protein [Marispirochaeta aestuarii]|uniref:patatin-like phospholipase family protein n=1 Tax=Marispirochaeta aestuarii TaxID=1963862 RepID=UPI0029C95138|nr:patatin-like phospholipase family protein [Marispirochaeta aestuarii]